MSSDWWKCDRCKRTDVSLTMSRLNTDMCCPECLAKEKKHPRYQEALEAEMAEVRKGNYNYPGLLAGEKIIID